VEYRAVDLAIEPDDPRFVADLRNAVAAWRVAPMLVVMTVVLEAVLITTRSLLFTAVALLTVGWPGVQRAWYLRTFTGRPMTLKEIPSLLSAYFARFFVAGLLIAVIFVPVLVVVLLAAPDHRTDVYVGLAMAAVIADLALTFVTPALTFAAGTVTEAFGAGFRMIARQWPACALYVLIPPLALNLFFRASRTMGPGRAIVLCVSALVALACKGATVRFYVRRAGVQSDRWLGDRPADGALPPPPEG
jgi:hypothetical protein